MGTVYETMNDDIKAFGVYRVWYNCLLKAPEIVDIHSYNHDTHHLHHYIKAQSYKNDVDWYKKHNIKQKLILLPAEMHEKLENPIYALDDKSFFRKYKIEKKRLLFSRKRWIEDEIRGLNGRGFNNWFSTQKMDGRSD